MQRRDWLMLAMASLGGPAFALPPAAMQFPRDLGSHPDFGTEWWYITGRAISGNREFGFQLTFFRSRVEATQAMTSRFAAKQLLFAHAATPSAPYTTAARPSHCSRGATPAK